MIQPIEIYKQALRWYCTVLTSSLKGVSLFPKDIRFGKIKPSQTLKDFQKIKTELLCLKENSKEQKGFGYSIDFIQRKDQKIGEQFFPSRIYFESLEDYLKFIKKEEEYKHFIAVTKQLIAEFPQLHDWVTNNPKKVLDNLPIWTDLIKVCRYFVHQPKPNIYIRELPLDISTKFVEENKAILRTLLDILIGDKCNNEETDFEMRFHLKKAEPLIRIKILDEVIAKTGFNGLNDLSIPQSTFNQLHVNCSRVIILENQTNFSNIYNFLTLPNIKGAIAIFGKGFQISLLKDAKWLHEKQIIYWGDIDVHGFQILSQLRNHFPKTTSCMMDFITFTKYQDLATNGPDTSITHLSNLTKEESDFYSYLLGRKERNRLEQEKIPHSYAISRIYNITDINSDKLE